MHAALLGTTKVTCSQAHSHVRKQRERFSPAAVRADRVCYKVFSEIFQGSFPAPPLEVQPRRARAALGAFLPDKNSSGSWRAFCAEHCCTLLQKRSRLLLTSKSSPFVRKLSLRAVRGPIPHAFRAATLTQAAWPQRQHCHHLATGFHWCSASVLGNECSVT